MENSTLTKPSQQQCADSPLTLDSLISEWVAKLAINAGIALDAKTQAVYKALWIEGLADLPAQILRAAFQKTLRECAYWPVKVADIRKHVSIADSAGLELEAEGAWDQWLAHVQKHFHPDIGWKLNAPHFDAITEHAGRAAGGASWVERCAESDLQWCRKRFIEAYNLAHETGQVQNLLTRDEAKKILCALLSGSELSTHKAHAPSAQSPTLKPLPLNDPIRAEFAALRKKINAPISQRLSDQEVEDCKQRELARFNRYLQEHPEIANASPRTGRPSADVPKTLSNAPPQLLRFCAHARDRLKCSQNT